MSKSLTDAPTKHKNCNCTYYDFQTCDYLDMLKNEMLIDINFQPDFNYRTCTSCNNLYHPRTLLRYGGICHTCYDVKKLEKN